MAHMAPRQDIFKRHANSLLSAKAIAILRRTQAWPVLQKPLSSERMAM